MTTETTAVKKTTAELLAIAVARVEKLQAKYTAEQMLNNVFVGDEIEFKYGRGEKATTYKGTVSGRREVETGVQLLVDVAGEDAFDSPRLKCFTRDVTVNYTRPIDAAVLAVANEEVADDTAPEGDDPLNAA